MCSQLHIRNSKTHCKNSIFVYFDILFMWNHQKTSMIAVFIVPQEVLGGSWGVLGGSWGGPWGALEGPWGPRGCLGGLRRVWWGHLGGSSKLLFLFFGRWICTRYSEILMFFILAVFFTVSMDLESCYCFLLFFKYLYVKRWGEYTTNIEWF